MDSDVLLRYKQKVKDFCCGIDPYSLEKENDPLPRTVQYFDVYHYCIENDSAYTHASFKAYKTLEAYKNFENGWVQSVVCKRITSGYIVLGKVNHSYRLSLKPLKCWVAVQLDGVILTGHCECMAGQGEVCSHVGAVLFVLEAWGRKASEIDSPETISCTDVLAKRLVPKMKSVEMAAVENICWSKQPNPTETDYPEDELIDLSQNVSALFSDFGEEPNNDDVDTSLSSQDRNELIDSFLTKIKENGVVCPIMAMREPFSTKFVPKKEEDRILDLSSDSGEENLTSINLYLASLYQPAYRSLTIEELRDIAEGVHLTYTQNEIDYIEEHTRQQSLCRLWFRFRTGRVTGSTFMKVCRTSVVKVAISIVETICYPERNIFKSEATEYGKKNEDLARRRFFEDMSTTHHNYEMKTTGLLINNAYPFFGVSPDAIVQCDCCGKGVVEIKCPYRLRFGDMQTYLKQSNCPLIWVDDKQEYQLSRKHEYYYQCQMQIFLADAEYCDFVMWNPKRIHHIRIFKDEDFWHENYPKATTYFKKILLPELLACYYTQKRVQK